MNYSAKINLENGIFFRAARLGVCVLSRGGVLFCASTDGRLRALLSVYNRFFGAENRAFVSEDFFAWNFFWREYRRETGCGRLPPWVYPADFEIELLWLQRTGGRDSG